MAADWDYGDVAAWYDARPPYAAATLDAAFLRADIMSGMRVCDVGAGTGRLTDALVARGLTVTAVEPDASMRARGAARPGAAWVAGMAEALPVRTGACGLVSFGSSFNVVEPTAALRESARVLAPNGWLLCVWNHRRLDDPLQRRIEATIHACVPGYAYGVRREDQRPIIAASAHFRSAERLESTTVREVETESWLDAWRSHLTLRRQAGWRFDDVLAAIAEVARGTGTTLVVPYTTVAWLAQRA